jgi:hypothetical protein
MRSGGHGISPFASSHWLGWRKTLFRNEKVLRPFASFELMPGFSQERAGETQPHQLLCAETGCSCHEPAPFSLPEYSDLPSRHAITGAGVHKDCTTVCDSFARSGIPLVRLGMPPSLLRLRRCRSYTQDERGKIWAAGKYRS